MAQRIVHWSKQSLEDQREILKYWKDKTGNAKYSNKLLKDFILASRYISKYPYIGKRVEQESARYYTKNDYVIFYEIITDYNNNFKVNILRIWDTRRNPQDLEIRKNFKL